jgi:predicted PurR-regulated permease PerM
MEILKQRMPAYAKASLLFIAGYALVYICYIGQGIILPLLFSGLFAVLLNPIVIFFQRRKIPRIISITLAIGIAFLLLTALIYFISAQLSMFGEKFPMLEKKFIELSNQSINWFSQTFNVPKSRINEWLLKTRSEALASSSSFIGNTLSTLTTTLVVLFLIPVYVFMMIYYEPLFIEFIKRVFPRNSHSKISEMITEAKSAMQQYLMGLLLEALIVAALNSAGLLILGIDYAILLGIIGALLNVIPYIGGIIAVGLSMLMALVTKDSSYMLFVMLVYLIIQFIDNHFIIPKIVASKVKINALVSVIAVLIGGALWGIPGMFLSIPLTAVIKIICDRIHTLKPYGYLLGDTMPESDNQFFSFRKRKTAPVKVK